MPLYELDLKDGTTVDFEAATPQEAMQEQQRLNEALVNTEVPPPRPADSFGQNLLDVGGEFASAANRATMQGLDFLGPGSINAGLRLGGIDYQLPTFEGAYEQTPGASGGFMDKGSARDLVRGAGGAAPAAAGFFPVAGRNIASPVGAALDFVGLGAAKPQPSVAPFSFGSQNSLSPAFALPGDIPPATATPQIPMRPSTRRLGDLIDAGSESVERAGKKTDPFTGRVITDQPAKASMKQGLDDGLTAMVQASTPETKAKLAQMLDIVDQGKKFKRDTIHRPGDVLGDALLDRFKVVKSANRQAGEMIDLAAESLKHEQVDVSGPVNSFIKNLEDMGVSLDVQPGEVSMGFRGSDIEGLDGPIKTLQRMVKRMADTDFTSAHDIHRIKKYIDENVVYGKSAEGLSGKTERVVKQLRAELDQVLDSNFENYRIANDQYSETIRPLKDLESLAGKRADLSGPNADKDIGVLLRRVLSNARSRVPIMDNANELDRVAKKYIQGGQEVVPYKGVLAAESIPSEINDDMLTLAMFADELERIFGTNATTSFLGDITKAVQRGAVDGAMTSGTSGLFSAAGDAVHSGIDRMRGINEENALKALRELVNASK